MQALLSDAQGRVLILEPGIGYRQEQKRYSLITNYSLIKPESTEKFIYPVFQKAFKDQGSLRAADYGHWTTENYTLDGDDRSAIAYSIPLILDDGTV